MNRVLSIEDNPEKLHISVYLNPDIIKKVKETSNNVKQGLMLVGPEMSRIISLLVLSPHYQKFLESVLPNYLKDKSHGGTEKISMRFSGYIMQILKESRPEKIKISRFIEFLTTEFIKSKIYADSDDGITRYIKKHYANHKSGN